MGRRNTDDDTTLSFDLGVETEEIDVPGHGGKSLKQAVFNWMLKTRALWMLTPQYADKIEAVVGIGLLFKIANLKIQWQSKHSSDHPALVQPNAERAKEESFEEFERFFKTLTSTWIH